ncbi:hypothetical protein [Yeosuana marina]|uniref:hypothetical protein n=1 Tax=Yeosuana marina TaxID=1565536 RepID=UPI0030ED514D|tara:strand:+ start:1661 stop:2098 length:438 start_codon:yes stop_codon:yes gene_type:complete
MKTLKTIVLSLILVLVVSCDKKPSKETLEFNSTFNEVMAVHDEVMPKMNEMGKLSAELKAKIDTTAVGKTYQKALDSLGNAHKYMMKWMEDFSNKFPYSDDRLKGKSTEEILSAIEELKKEKTKVDAVRNALNGSINNAKTVLAN